MDEELYLKVKSSLSLLNGSNSGLEFQLPAFIRLALLSFCDRLLSEGLNLSFKPRKL